MAKKNALDELFKRAEAASEEAARLRAEASDLRDKANAAREKAQDSAKAGDVNGYMKQNAEAEKLDATAYVNEKHADERAASISAEDVVSAWESYQKEYAIEFKSKYEALKRTRAELIRLFLELLEMQNNALRLRDRAGRLAGIFYNAFEDTEVTFRRLPLPLMDKYVGSRSPEADLVEQYSDLGSPSTIIDFRRYVGGIIQARRPQTPYK